MAFPTQSASLNGTTQGFSIADSATTSPTGDLTCEAWVKLNSEPGTGVEYDIFAKHDNGNSANGRCFTFTYLNSAGTTNFTVRTSTNGTSGGQLFGSLNHTFGANAWHHIAMSYVASTGIATIIKDGVSIGTITGLTTSIFDGTVPLCIGIRSDLVSASLNGHIGLARLWKGVAQSASTINTNKCTVFGSAQTNLSGEWSLDNVLTDASGNANTLTNIASTPFTADVTSSCTVAGISNRIYAKLQAVNRASTY